MEWWEIALLALFGLSLTGAIVFVGIRLQRYEEAVDQEGWRVIDEVDALTQRLRRRAKQRRENQ